jgi:uncharacterized protein (DUF58 family)
MAAREAAVPLPRPRPCAALRTRLRARAAAWVRRRQGADRLPVTLERRRLYILPTRGGLAFAALVFVMLLAGLNYGNSLALFLTFLLGAFGLVVMQQCHRNLLGTVVIAAEAPAVFAARAATVVVTLGNPTDTPRLGIEAALEDPPHTRADLPALARARLAVSLAPQRRGVVRIARVRIATAHPFALFRAWTWIHAPLELIVYPGPAGTVPMPAEGAQPGATGTRTDAGLDEWVGLRAFRDGDSPRQVDWKAYAREAPLLVKEYQSLGAELRVFDFARVPLEGTEARLAQLARWVVDAEARGERYALRLPGSAPEAADRGPQHRHRCLALLARFGTEPAGGAPP